MTTTPTPASPTSTPTTDELAARLRLDVTRLARILRQQTDPGGLSPTQLAALATIERSGPMPIGALAEIEQVTAPTATKVVTKLVAAGLVDRVADGEDRRVKRIQVTPAGHRFLSRLRARKTAWLTSRLADLHPADLEALAAALGVLEQLTEPPTREP